METVSPNIQSNYSELVSSCMSVAFSRNWIPLLEFLIGFRMAEIRDGASTHQLKEFETLSIGVPLTVRAVHSILWV